MNHLDDLAGLDMLAARRAAATPPEAAAEAPRKVWGVARMRALWRPRELTGEGAAGCCPQHWQTSPAHPQTQRAADVLPFHPFRRSRP